MLLRLRSWSGIVVLALGALNALWHLAPRGEGALRAKAPAAIATVDAKPAPAKATRPSPHATTVSAALADPTLVSAEGREIELHRYAPRGPIQHRFLIQGGLHGDEEGASRFVVWLSRRYARGESPLNALARQHGVQLDFVPYANPDGVHALDRYNARGVNLNRNFDVLWGLTRENPGASAFSEPEARAIRRLFEQQKYTASVDVHGYVNWIVAPSDPTSLAKHKPQLRPTGHQLARYRGWMAALAEEMTLLTGYQLKTAAGLGDGGAFEDWAFWGQGSFAFCLELESLQRYATPYRRDFADITRASDAPKIDLWKRYEAYVTRMFQRAIELQSGVTDEQLASGG